MDIRDLDPRRLGSFVSAMVWKVSLIYQPTFLFSQKHDPDRGFELIGKRSLWSSI
jgi:hypothetical protein